MNLKPVNSINNDGNTIRVSDGNSPIRLIFKDVKGEVINLYDNIDYFYLTKDDEKFYSVTDISYDGDEVIIRLPKLKKGQYKAEIRDKDGSIYPANEDLYILLRRSFEDDKDIHYFSHREDILNSVEPIIIQHIDKNPNKFKGERGQQGFPGRDGVRGIDGKDGIDGEKGEKGDKGDKGDPGIDVSNVEIVDSRGEFEVLGDRIEYIQNGIEEEFEKRNISKTPNTNLHSFKEKRVLNTFIDDDGSTEVMNKLKPLSEQYDIPFVVALIGNRIENGTGITVDQALSLQNDLGWEIASHEYDHIALDEVTDPEKVLYEIKYSQEYLRSFGMDVRNIVYPFGRINKEILDLSARFYNCGVSTSNGTNTSPVRTFALKRISFPHTSANNSLQWYKNIVDTAKENNEWIIWMLHCGMVEHDATNQQILSDLIAYIQSQEIETVTLQEGLEIYGNAVSINDEQYYIGADGKNNMINYEVLNNDQSTGIEKITPQMIPNEFEKSKTFVNHINTAGSRVDTPNNKSGTLTTIITAVTHFSYQTFMTDNGFYVRYSNTGGTEWGDWIEYSVKKNNIEMELRALPVQPGSTLEPTLYDSGINVNDLNILIPLSVIPSELTWNYYSTGNGAIKIRFYNTSDTKVDLPETNWRLIRSR